MRLHIVRHGQTHWNVQRRIQGQLDSELDEQGIAQAIERGKDFKGMPLAAAYCSSSVRTRQTIDKLLDGQTSHVQYQDALKEVHWGIWQGRMWVDVEVENPDMVEAYHKALAHFHVDGAETPLQTQQRGIEAVEAIVQTHKNAPDDANVLIVSHGAIMKKILGHYTQIALTELHKLPPLPNCAHCIVDVQNDERKVTHISGQLIEQTPWSAFIR